MVKYDHYNKNNDKKTINDKPTEENQNFINMEELLKTIENQTKCKRRRFSEMEYEKEKIRKYQIAK